MHEENTSNLQSPAMKLLVASIADDNSYITDCWTDKKEWDGNPCYYECYGDCSCWPAGGPGCWFFEE
ncbi:MAG: hypothetical protein Q4C70_00395 [Planctomycetia bacterium]|nr:hypothetical protein [Planctomycetia bacterium]